MKQMWACEFNPSRRREPSPGGRRRPFLSEASAHLNNHTALPQDDGDDAMTELLTIGNEGSTPEAFDAALAAAGVERRPRRGSSLCSVAGRKIVAVIAGWGSPIS